VLRSATELSPGDEITTVLADGQVRSTVSGDG
jgi:3-dehydroquinate synthase class II